MSQLPSKDELAYTKLVNRHSSCRCRDTLLTIEITPKELCQDCFKLYEQYRTIWETLIPENFQCINCCTKHSEFAGHYPICIYTKQCIKHCNAVSAEHMNAHRRLLSENQKRIKKRLCRCRGCSKTQPS